MSEDEPRGPTPSVLRRLTSFLTQRSTPSDKPITERGWLFVVALVLFAITSVAAWISLPESDVHIRWALVVALVLVGTPANLAATGYEFVVMARLLGIRIETATAARVAVLSSAANLLPLPGSLLVRAVALRERGAAYSDVGAAVASMAVGLLTMTGIVSGLVLLAAGDTALGAVLLSGGVFGILLLWVLTRSRGVTRPLRTMLDVLGAESCLIIVVGMRLWLVLPALGFAASFSQAAALAAASVAATATGIFPAGLGVREIFSGAAAALVDLPVSVGVVAGAVDRVALGIGLAPIAVWMLAAAKRNPAP